MTRDPRYDVLFEPVRIGPVTARNRFYQPPHCNGMGRIRPRAHARMRGIKAEGGWGRHQHRALRHPPLGGDVSRGGAYSVGTIATIPPLALMCEAVHEHGALAGVQLAYGVYWNSNRLSREVPMGPMHRPVSNGDPVQARAMDKRDIHDLLGWWAAASERALRAGFDIINVDGNFSTAALPVPLAPQPPHRRIRRQPREPRPPLEGDDRG